MHDQEYSYFFKEKFESFPTVKPNRITGEGRMKPRAHKDKLPDLKKRKHRKMAKKSKRANRR